MRNTKKKPKKISLKKSKEPENISVRKMSAPETAKFNAVIEENKRKLESSDNKTKNTAVIEKSAKRTPKDYAVLLAVSRQDFKSLQRACEEGANISAKNKYGWNALHIAALYGDAVSGEYLCEKGISINVLNSEGNTAAHIAAYLKKDDFMKELMKYDVDLNVKNNFGFTPFGCAAQAKGYKVCESIILYGYNPTKDEFDSIGNFKVRDYLRELNKQVQKKNVNDKSYKADTEKEDKVLQEQRIDAMLVDAVYRNDIDGAKKALARGANINAVDNKNWTPLHWAAWHNNVDMIWLLYGNGAEINALNSNHETPSSIASGRGQLNALEVLLLCSPDLTIKNIWGHNAFENAAVHEQHAVCMMFADNDYIPKPEELRRVASYPARMELIEYIGEQQKKKVVTVKEETEHGYETVSVHTEEEPDAEEEISFER